MRNILVCAICFPLIAGSVVAENLRQPLSVQPTAFDYDQNANAVEYTLDGDDDFRQQWNGGREQPKMSTVGFSKNLGTMGAISMQGSAYGGSPRVGVGHSYFGGRGWLKGIESRVESDDFQTLFSAGVTAALWQTDTGILATRALGGYALRHGDASEDSFHSTIDLYGARSIMNGRHWLKAGWFVDQQEEVGKHGPELGMLLFTDRCNPLTVDIAYGLGWGHSELIGNEFVQAADDDIQLRVGTILNNRFHVGATLQYLQFDAFGVENSNEVWEGGAFASFAVPCGRVRLDGTTGELGTSGMLSFVWIPGGGNIFQQVPTCCGCVCRPEGWLSTPVSRRTGVRVRRHSNAAAGPLFGLSVAGATLNLIADAGAPGLNIGDADQATVSLQLVNRTGRVIEFEIELEAEAGFDGVNNPVNVPIMPPPPGGGAITVTGTPNVGVVTQLIKSFDFEVAGQTRRVEVIFAPGAVNGAAPTAINVL